MTGGRRSNRAVRKVWPLVLVAGVWAVSASDLLAHSGRRLLIEVVDGQLQAQGVNTGPDDGLPAIRPYLGAIHDHWRNVESLGSAYASLPGFDVSPSASSALSPYHLDLRLLGVTRWANPPADLSTDPVPLLEPLASDQLVTIAGPYGEVSSTSPGTLRLIEEFPFGGVTDLDLVYQTNQMPAYEIHVMRFVLSATAKAGHTGGVQVADSTPIYLLLSPDGANPMEKLHHASLYLEQYVAALPEPGTLITLSLGLAIGAIARRRRH